MDDFSFAGTYEDARGTEVIVWHVVESGAPTHPLHGPRFEIRTSIRGVEVWGYDFDGLEPVDTPESGGPALNAAGELGNCVLTGELPCIVELGDSSSAVKVHFSLDLATAVTSVASPRNLSLSVVVEGEECTVVHDWFEDGVQQLEDTLPNGARLRCCVTCLYSDYSPAGHGLTGMRCHRDVKDQYLSVRSKSDYWSVAVTEDVLETYVCNEYARRVPGTGYRG